MCVCVFAGIFRMVDYFRLGSSEVNFQQNFVYVFKFSEGFLDFFFFDRRRNVHGKILNLSQESLLIWIRHVRSEDLREFFVVILG